MDKTSRAASIISSRANPFKLKACFFHSTPVLERRRRGNWEYGGSFRGSPRRNHYSKMAKFKHDLLRDVSEYAERIFQNWQSASDNYNESSNPRNSWSRSDFEYDGFRRGNSRNRRSQAWKRDFIMSDSDDDEVEFESIFRSAFGGKRYSFWSFTANEQPRYRSSSTFSNSYRTFDGWTFRDDEEEYESSWETDKPDSDMTSDRVALGLSASGPLNIDDVKIAYRACALKWHPDRHQGSSKALAEEKFKMCSAAYKSLCDKLAMN